MVGHSELSVTEPATDTDYLHVGVVVASVVAELLEASQCRKVAYGVRDGDVAFECESRGHGRHVLLSDAGIQELVWKTPLEIVENAETEITCQ
jgi:hypothetical protein